MYKIMIVDDEKIIVEGLAEMLGDSGLPFSVVDTAGSAAEALEKHREVSFDFILTDIRMPRMDGLELFEKVKAIADGCKVIFLSGYSDFEYARTALKLGASDYLLKPVEDEEVVACLRKAIELLEQERSRLISQEQTEKKLNDSLPYAQGEFFRNLLHSLQDIPSSLLDDKLRELHIPFRSTERVTGFVMSLDNMEKAMSFMDDALLQFMLHNMIDELLGDSCHFRCFAAGNGVIAVLIQSKEPESDEGLGYAREKPVEVFDTLHGRLREVQEIVGRAFKVVCSFALLNEWIPWEQWAYAYGRLIGGIKLRIGQGQIFVPSREPTQISQASQGVTSDMLLPVMEAINLKDVPAFAAGLDRLLEQIDRTTGISENDLTAWFLSISGRIVGLSQQNRAASAIRPEDMARMSNLRMHNNLTQLRSFLVRMLQEVVDEIGMQQRNPTELLVGQVKQYIETHLYENLSLEMLADKAHVNPSYLSRVFKQYTHEQLTAYVTRLKMEQAAKLLRDNGMRVQDVATRLGFDNPNYFAKVFRKATGLSPHEYRVHHSAIR
ncbi:response regulator transcription factor [Cohnella herbarum]|uniref:Response regulator n=1 Tax=Cohnella herbarum TaxID=2728023 RepID=A0A7Z2VP56_9BACL|nr:response regulator [Cohnella herbarum]QJD86582.1 response regulator [Cohnella herbarum]